MSHFHSAREKRALSETVLRAVTYAADQSAGTSRAGGLRLEPIRGRDVPRRFMPPEYLTTIEAADARRGSDNHDNFG